MTRFRHQEGPARDQQPSTGSLPRNDTSHCSDQHEPKRARLRTPRIRRFNKNKQTHVTFFFLFSLSWRPDTSLVLASAVLSS